MHVTKPNSYHSTIIAFCFKSQPFLSHFYFLAPLALSFCYSNCQIWLLIKSTVYCLLCLTKEFCSHFFVILAGLSDNVNVDEFARVCINTSNMDPLPITVLTGLLLCEDDVSILISPVTTFLSNLCHVLLVINDLMLQILESCAYPVR